jgi:hypothetical protein
MVLELPHGPLADRELVEKVTALGGNWRDEAPLAPPRRELLALATS